MLGDTQTLSFPPWFFQQVLNRSKGRVSGSVSDTAKARAPCRGILKAKNPHTVHSRRRVPLTEPGTSNTGISTSCGVFSHSSLPPSIKLSSTRVPAQRRCHRCHRTQHHRDGHHSQPLACGQSGLLLPGLAARSDASKKPVGTRSTGTFITIFRQSTTAQPSPTVLQTHSHPLPLHTQNGQKTPISWPSQACRGSFATDATMDQEQPCLEPDPCHSLPQSLITVADLLLPALSPAAAGQDDLSDCPCKIKKGWSVRIICPHSLL